MSDAKKHIRAIRNLICILITALYFSILPAVIVRYGIDAGIPAFDNGAPFHEVYSVFTTAWIAGHAVTFFVLFGLYMLCYGIYRDGR